MRVIRVRVLFAKTKSFNFWLNSYESFNLLYELYTFPSSSFVFSGQSGHKQIFPISNKTEILHLLIIYYKIWQFFPMIKYTQLSC